MNGLTRAWTMLLAALAAGFLLWLAAQFNMQTTGGYWAAMGVVAGGGLLVGAAQLRGGGGNPPGTFLIAFLPVLILAGWVLLVAQPNANWFHDHLRAWDGHMGITGAVNDLSLWNGVLAFGIGLVFACVLEPGMMMVRRRETVATTSMPVPPTAPAVDRTAADEPTTAERQEAEAEAAAVDRPVTRDHVPIVP